MRNLIINLIKKKLLSNIKLVIFDVDGVLTNGYLLQDNSGEISRSFNSKDGLGIKLLLKERIHIAIISGGTGESISQRAKNLNIKYCLTNIKNKLQAIKELKLELKMNAKETIFIGDDINDLVVREEVNLLICPIDSSKYIINKSNLVLSNKGGEGAVRELSERILISKGKMNLYKNDGFTETN